MTDNNRRPNRRLSRRSALRSAVALTAGTMAGCTADGASSHSLLLNGQRPRVAILGAGAGGIFSAYFLHGECDVDLFESRHKVGGHCDSVTFDYRGFPMTADLGAQFFHPDTHPLYVTMLEEMGLYDPEDPDGDETIEAPGGVCIFPTGGWPLLSSALPFFTPFHAANFAIYAQFARDAILSEMSWEITVSDWIDSLPVAGSFKRDVLFPWISALIGTNYENAAISSARSILQTFALAFPENLLEGATTYNSKIGLGGNLERVLAASPGVNIHLNAPIVSTEFQDGEWFVTTPSGRHGPYDVVVSNAPPRVSKEFLAPLPWAADIVAQLDRYRYFDARLLIHTDSAYMHPYRMFWAAYNAGIDSDSCEGSVWYEALQGKLPDGRRRDVFKSWAYQRDRDPSNILFERRFVHPHITPDVVRATRELGTMQGRNGLYFAGQHTTGMDLQEACVYSAMKVADAVAPESTTLSSLRARLELRGRTGISYEV